MEELNKLIQAQFNRMCETNKLFEVEIPGIEIWDLSQTDLSICLRTLKNN